jgi:predicted dehydrogenase
MTSKSGLSFKPWERVEIFGSGAYLVIDDQLEVTLFDDETGPAKSWKPAVPNTLMFDESFGGYSGLLENVLDAIRGLVPLSTTGADGARAVGLIEGIRRALASGTVIDMKREGLLL